jgi:hypothetical protein
MSFNYSDIDNVHTSSVQQKFRDSLKSLSRDVLVINFRLANIILQKHGLKDFTYDTISKQVTTGLSMSEIITYIVNRAIQHENKDEILDLLVYMMTTSSNLCFTGQITNWLSVLGGYFSDIDMGINKYDKINNYLDYLKQQCEGDRLFEKFYIFISEFDILDIEKEAYYEALIDYILEDRNYITKFKFSTTVYTHLVLYKGIIEILSTIPYAIVEPPIVIGFSDPIYWFPEQTIGRAVRYTNNDFDGDEAILSSPDKKLVLPKPVKITYPKQIYKQPKLKNYNGKHNYSKNFR